LSGARCFRVVDRPGALQHRLSLDQIPRERLCGSSSVIPEEVSAVMAALLRMRFGTLAKLRGLGAASSPLRSPATAASLNQGQREPLSIESAASAHSGTQSTQIAALRPVNEALGMARGALLLGLETEGVRGMATGKRGKPTTRREILKDRESKQRKKQVHLSSLTADHSLNQRHPPSALWLLSPNVPSASWAPCLSRSCASSFCCSCAPLCPGLSAPISTCGGHANVGTFNRTIQIPKSGAGNTGCQGQECD